MNHDIGFKMINVDVKCSKRYNKEGKRGDVHANKIIGNLALDDKYALPSSVKTNDD